MRRCRWITLTTVRGTASVAVIVATFSTTAAAARAPASLQDYMSQNGPAATAVFRYGPAPSQRVELVMPQDAGDGPFPVAILIHGGCWNSRFEGLPQFRAIAAGFAAHGIAVWNVEYRRVDETGGGFPGTYLDIASALDMLVDTAADRHLDLSRLVAVGHSAGAQLALWAAARARIPASSPLHAIDTPAAPGKQREPGVLAIPTVVSLGGLPDLRDDADAIENACGVDPVALTGTPSAGRPDVLADTSPAAMLPIGTNTVEINGEHDAVAPPALARRYAYLAQQAGDRVRSIVIPDAGHFDEAMTSSPVWPTLLATVLDALGLPRR